MPSIGDSSGALHVMQCTVRIAFVTGTVTIHAVDDQTLLL
jgi:hypothetical protein